MSEESCSQFSTAMKEISEDKKKLRALIRMCMNEDYLNALDEL